MKSIEELNALKADCEKLGAKLAELTEEELVQVTGGESDPIIVHIDTNDPHCAMCPEGRLIRTGTTYWRDIECESFMCTTCYMGYRHLGYCDTWFLGA